MTDTLCQRTPEEVLKRYEERRQADHFGFETSEYIDYLGYEFAKPHLKDGTTEEEFNQWANKNPLDRMRDYMDFAFGKAFDNRGLSANRSIQHYIAWIWLNGDDEFANEIEAMYENDYHAYGVYILRKICGKYGWNSSQFGDLGGEPTGD